MCDRDCVSTLAKWTDSVPVVRTREVTAKWVSPSPDDPEWSRK